MNCLYKSSALLSFFFNSPPPLFSVFFIIILSYTVFTLPSRYNNVCILFTLHTKHLFQGAYVPVTRQSISTCYHTSTFFFSLRATPNSDKLFVFANVSYIRIKRELSVLERGMRTSQEITELISKNPIQSRVQGQIMGCGTTDDKICKQYTKL